MNTRPPNIAPLAYSRQSAPTTTNSLGVHFLALLTAIATFPLICMGGLVTSHHAGMSVPDWPNSYGYNMFLFPPSRWVGGILYEHTHRLMATVVGMLSITLVIWAWRREIVCACVWLLQVIGLGDASDVSSVKASIPRERHRYLAIAVLAAVIFQGVLGGLRVVLVKLDLAIIHACVAQAFFCLTAYMALVTSDGWNSDRDRAGVLVPNGLASSQRADSILSRTLFYLGIITVGAIYLQLVVGATMRHFDAGLAIPDLPLVYGKLLPPTTPDGLSAVNHQRAFAWNLDPVTLTQIWLHFAHRIGATIVSLLVIALSIRALRTREVAGLIVPALLLLLLLCGQLTLGVLTVLLRKPADVASAHVAVGALVLVTAFILTVRVGRMQRRTVKVISENESTIPASARLATN